MFNDYVENNLVRRTNESEKFPAEFETFFNDLLCELAKVSSVTTPLYPKFNLGRKKYKKLSFVQFAS